MVLGQVDVRLDVHAVFALGDVGLFDLHPTVAEGDEAVDPRSSVGRAEPGLLDVDFEAVPPSFWVRRNCRRKRRVRLSTVPPSVLSGGVPTLKNCPRTRATGSVTSSFTSASGGVPMPLRFGGQTGAAFEEVGVE